MKTSTAPQDLRRAMRALVLGVAAASAAASAHAEVGDAQAGARAFFLCSTCHAVSADGPAKTGPVLVGVFGKRAGASDAAFAYSPALKAAGVTWNERTLDAWLSAPAQLVPGTKMAFAGVPDAKTRANLIARLRQLKATEK